ncbi:MAG: elongation factor P hydroxylase [Proteobacteria bacterium]|nr:elongation factor P hydroxylase [Pseudomonadota bacterium]
MSAIPAIRLRSYHAPADLVQLFDAAFRDENTLLLPHPDAWKGNHDEPASEPVYLPASEACPHDRIVFAHGFFASALHEVAHWCLSGARRRRLPDYGYWYQADGRDAEQQAEFERVEARPQALEWAFSIACDFPFRISTDNLSGITPDHEAFRRKVRGELRQFVEHGFPERAKRFIDVLVDFYATNPQWADID